MEFDEILVRAKGVIYSYTETDDDYSRLIALKDDLNSVDDTAKRRMVFFFVLNTRMNVSELLSADPYVSYVSQICKRFDFRALGFTIFNLNLCKYLSPIALNSPAAFTVEVLNGIFPYAQSKAQLEGLEYVIPALLQKILKILKNDHKESQTTYKLWELLHTCADMLWSRKMLDAEALNGRDVYVILEICLVCVKIYEGNIPLSFDPMFEIKMKEPPSNQYDFDLLPDPDSDLEFRDFLLKLLNYFDDIQSSCTLTDLPVSDQRRMNERAHILYEKLDISDYRPRNVHVLNSMKEKAETARTRIPRISVGIIINCVEPRPGAKYWLKGLIYSPELLKNEEAVACIKKYSALVDIRDLKTLMSIIEEEAEQNMLSDYVADLYFVALRKMTLIDQVYHLEKTLTFRQNFKYEDGLLDIELIETFNKITIPENRNFNFKAKLIKFCILSPLKTIKKICEQAIFNQSELHYGIEVLMMLEPACTFRCPSLEDSDMNIITSVLCNAMDNKIYNLKEELLLKSLILKLNQEDFLGEKFEGHIMKIVQNDFEALKYETAEFALEILVTVIKSKRFYSNKVVTLGFLSQILNHASWSSSSFSVKKEQIREKCITGIRSLMENPELAPTGKELAWLRMKIMKCEKIHRLYFTDLWYLYDSKLIPSPDLHVQILLLIHSKIRAESICQSIRDLFKSQIDPPFSTTLAAVLFQILPILTSSEWLIIWTRMGQIVYGWLEWKAGSTNIITVGLVVLQVVAKSLFCLAQDMNENQNMIPCFGHCIRNFATMIQTDILSRENLKIDEAYVVIHEVMFLLNGVADSAIKFDCSVILFPVVNEIFNRFKNEELGHETNLAKFKEQFTKDFLRVPNE